MRLAWRNLLHDRTRLAVTVAGIAFAVFLMVFEGSLLAGFLRASSEVIDAAEADLWITARGVPAFDFPAPLPERYRSLALGVEGVAAIDRIATHFGQWLRPDGSQQTVIVIGTEPEAPGRFPRPAPAAGGPDLPESVVVDRSDIDALGLAELPVDVEITGRRARVVATTTGFGSFLGSPYVFTRYEDATRYIGLSPQRTTFLLCRLAPGASPAVVKRRIARRLPEADVWTQSEFSRRSRQYWVLQTGAGGAILTAGLLGFVVGVVIVSQTVYATTMENLEEYATLRAMGATRRYLCRLVLTQALLGGVIGCALGLGASYPCVAALRGGIPWVHTPWWMPLGMLGASLVMGAVASVTSIRTVLRVEPGRVFRA